MTRVGLRKWGKGINMKRLLAALALLGGVVSVAAPAAAFNLNVFVTSAGDLVIHGTYGDDTVSVKRAYSSERDEGVPETLEVCGNGLCQAYHPVTRNIRILTFDGNDEIVVCAANSPRDLVIDSGRGDDDVSLGGSLNDEADGVQIGDDLSVKLGDGDDKLSFDFVRADDDITIDLGSGDDTANAAYLRSADMMTVKLGPGNDVFGSGSGSDLGETISSGGKAVFKGGSDNDEIGFFDPYFPDQLNIQMGGGDDRFSVSAEGYGGLNQVSFNGGSGDDDVFVGPTSILGRNVWNGAAGNDTIRFSIPPWFPTVEPILRNITLED